MSCELQCGRPSCLKQKLHDKLGEMLKSTGFSKFVEVETPRHDVWMRGQNALAVEEQAVLVAIEEKTGRVDLYLGLGTTIDTEHEKLMVDRLGAHLAQFL